MATPIGVLRPYNLFEKQKFVGLVWFGCFDCFSIVIVIVIVIVIATAEIIIVFLLLSIPNYYESLSLLRHSLEKQ
jgi:hypothetical protein